MNALRDTLIAMIFAAMVALIALKIDANTKENNILTRQALETQESLHNLTDVLEYDIRKIGHSLINPFGGILLADTSHIILAYDQDPGSQFDSISVEYYTELAENTPNPNDLKLIRKVNGNSAMGVALGLTSFNLKYFNAHGLQLPTPVCSDSLSVIREIELSIGFQSREGFKGDYSGAKYVTRIIPKNLLIRFSNQ